MDYVFNSLGAAVPALLVVLGLRPVTDRELTSFAVRYFLVEEMMSPALSRAIAHSRGMRLLGAALGLSLPAVIRAFTHDSLDTGVAVLWGATGYMGGALLAVLVPIARASEPVHAAMLVPRRVRDYVPLRTLAAPGVAVGLGLTAALAFAWGPRRSEASGIGVPMAALFLAVVAALATGVGSRWVVRRRQPVPDPEVLAVDDALRSHALRLVFGTGITVGALATCTIIFQLGSATSVQILRWTCPWIGLAEVAFAVYAGGGQGNNRWEVRHKVHS